MLFEVDQRVEPHVKRTTATTKLYTNGAWTTEFLDADGKRARTAFGCLVASQLNGIAADLKSATWNTSHRSVTCRADSQRFTVYKWNGRTLFTDRTCNPDVLDPESQRTLGRIEISLHIPDDLDGGSHDRTVWRIRWREGATRNVELHGCHVSGMFSVRP